MSRWPEVSLYIHPGWYAHRWGATGRALNRLPADFRRASPAKPVKGGRWGVRKLAVPPPDGLLWSAYSKGQAALLSKRFTTQEEAFAHALSMVRLVAQCEKSISVTSSAVRRTSRRMA